MSPRSFVSFTEPPCFSAPACLYRLDAIRYSGPTRSAEPLVDRNCLFCQIVARELASDIVNEDDDVVAFNDISPQAPTHILIIPKRHVATVNDVADVDAEVFGKLVLCARSIAKTRGIADSGYRLIFNCNAEAGQTIYHVHLHLLGGRQLRALG